MEPNWKTLCSNGCCCPEARQLPNQSVQLREDGITQEGKVITLTAEQIVKLAEMIGLELW